MKEVRPSACFAACLLRQRGCLLSYCWPEVGTAGRDNFGERLWKQLLSSLPQVLSLGAQVAATSHPPLRCATSTLPQFVDVISSYPLTPSPDIFGLHDNADITCEQASHAQPSLTPLRLMPTQAWPPLAPNWSTRHADAARAARPLPSFQAESYGMLGTLLVLQPRASGGGGGESQEDAIARIANGILSKVRLRSAIMGGAHEQRRRRSQARRGILGYAFQLSADA